MKACNTCRICGRWIHDEEGPRAICLPCEVRLKGLIALRPLGRKARVQVQHRLGSFWV